MIPTRKALLELVPVEWKFKSHVTATEEHSLSLWERAGVRGYALSIVLNPSPGAEPVIGRAFRATRWRRPLPVGEVAGSPHSMRKSKDA
jgi:hypothetical protein